MNLGTFHSFSDRWCCYIMLQVLFELMVSISGVMMIFITFFGIVGNVLLIILFTNFKTIQNRTTTLQRSMAVSDLILAFFGAGMFTINCFSHRQAFGLPGIVQTQLQPLFSGWTSMGGNLIHLLSWQVSGNSWLGGLWSSGYFLLPYRQGCMFHKRRCYAVAK